MPFRHPCTDALLADSTYVCYKLYLHNFFVAAAISRVYLQPGAMEVSITDKSSATVYVSEVYESCMAITSLTVGRIKIAPHALKLTLIAPSLEPG